MCLRLNSIRSLTAMLALLLAGEVSAQVNSATLLGTVRDTSGASIPNATITSQNVETAQVRVAKSDPGGNYTIPNLQVGRYQLTVAAPGFKTATVTGLELQVAQMASANVVLEVGQMSEFMNVTAETPLMNTVSSTVSQMVDTKAVENMPLNGRSFWQLAQLTPGAAYRPGGQNIAVNGVSIRASAVNININGLPPIWTGWALDGADITEAQLGGTIIQPSVDAIQEFRVEGANMAAEYGHTPTLINATLKSGTNRFNGNVYWFFRNNAMDARNFFFIPPPGVNQRNEPLHRNQMGGTLGGPIRRDKTFFFVDFESTQLSKGQNFNNVVGSAAQRQGNFAGLKTLTDPLGGTFGNNMIPASRISQQAKFFLPYLPDANFVSGVTNRAIITNALAQSLNKGDIKIDHQLTGKDHLMGRYTIADNDESDPNPYPAIGAFPLHSRGQNAVIALNHIFSPSLINEARVSYYRSYFYFGGALQGQDINAMAGIKGLSGQADPGFPQIVVSGYSTFTGSPSDSRPKSNRLRSWEYADNMTYTNGKHNVKFGYSLKHNLNTFIAGNLSVGTFTFLGTYTGDGFADFLLGYPDNVQRSYFRNLWGNKANFQSLYVQDDYRVRSNVTVNVGLRYEISPFYDAVGGQTSAFDFQTGKLVLPTDFSLTAQPQTALLYPLFKDRIVLAKDLGLPNSIRQTGYKDWAPRIGVAWRPTGSDRWVVRSGYGIFYAFPDANLLNNTQNVVPFNGTQTVTNTRPPAVPQLTFADFFQGQPIVLPNPNPGQPCSFGFVANSCSTPNVVSAPTQLRSTYSQQWNFSVQHQIASRVTLDVAYVGNRTIRVEQTILRNDPSPGAGAIQTRRPYPQWGGINSGEWGGNQHYNALQVKFQAKEWHGASFLTSYAYSKCIDNGSGEQGTITALLITRNTGPCDFDLHHNLTVSYAYALPVGRGKSFLGGIPRWADAVIGGWNVAGITTAQSGLPFTPTISTDNANTGVGGQRPNVIGTPIVIGDPNCWFYISVNSACGPSAPGAANAFAVPAQFTYGNSGRNILRADKLVEFNFTARKRFQFTETRALEFRTEFFNILNSPAFSAPSTNINVASGAQVGSTLNAARTIELAVKIFF
jgi:hypothetical protein